MFGLFKMSLTIVSMLKHTTCMKNLITGKITSTTSLDSYTYGVTPGISAVWPSSPRSPDSFVVCHRDQGSNPAIYLFHYNLVYKLYIASQEHLHTEVTSNLNLNSEWGNPGLVGKKIL